MLTSSHRNESDVKLQYSLALYHNKTSPLFVPIEALNVIDDFLLPAETHVDNFFPKFNKTVSKNTPTMSSPL